MFLLTLLGEFLEESKIEFISYRTDTENAMSFYDDYYIEEEQKTNELIHLILGKREKKFETFLKEHDNYFGFNLVDEGIQYTFLNFPVYTTFSKEQAMELFHNFIDENEYNLTSPRFLLDFFSLLKKTAVIPKEYELVFATNKPDEKWEGIKHCVVYKQDKVIHSKYYKNIVQVLNNLYNKSYVDIFVLESWAKEVFCAIEEEEKHATLNK